MGLAVLVSVGIPAVPHCGRSAGGSLRRQERHGVRGSVLVAGDVAHTLGSKSVTAYIAGGSCAHGPGGGRGDAVHEQHDFQVRYLGNP